MLRRKATLLPNGPVFFTGGLAGGGVNGIGHSAAPNTAEVYRTAVRLNPNLAEPHYNLGIALMDHGNGSAAVKDLEEFIRLAPNTPSNRQKIDEVKKRLNKLRVPEKGPGNF